MQSSSLALSQSLSCSVKSVCSISRSPISLDSYLHICPTRSDICPHLRLGEQFEAQASECRDHPFATWTMSLVQPTYPQPTSSGPRRVYPVSIPNTKSMNCYALITCVLTHKYCRTACFG
ncbi:unnamed protein product [Protopolystoma xenopodis]|uniref:Uncharacterized protein n=1 Tax=Protopolystoma xenopodis TaxID=117903 RepID=A0A448WJQ9_9PLAT|nr:unnamed protein product [Protopolystoma xenopodis]